MGAGVDFSKWLHSGGAGIRHRAGSSIFLAGDAGTAMYIVREGTVDIRVAEDLLEKVGPGGLIGEMTLVDDGPRSASAFAATECELIPIDRRRFLYLVQETPTFALEVMRVFADRLRRMNDRFG